MTATARKRRGRRTQAERSATTRERLLDATVATLVERGWHGASTAAICKRARVTRGAQLHHWPTKAELVAAAIEHLFQRRHAELRAVLEGAPAGPDALPAVFAKLWEIYSGPTLVAWLELVVAARTDPPLLAAIRGVDDRFTPEAEATLCRLLSIEPGPRAQAATRLVVSLLDGLALNHQIQGPAARPGPALELVQELLGPLGRRGSGEARTARKKQARAR